MRVREIDLLAEVADVGLEHTGVAAEVVVPDVVEELGSGEHPTRVREQVAKQPVFGCRQVDELAGASHFVSVVIHLEVRELEQFAGGPTLAGAAKRSEEHTSELQSLRHLVCRLLLE